jgi:predicted MPP superfamily phosphohydrolase
MKIRYCVWFSYQTYIYVINAIITGDAIDDTASVPLLDEFLSFLPQKIEKLSVLGNWEHWGNIDISKLDSIYKTHNGKLLLNETYNFVFNNKEVRITGVDDFVTGLPSLRVALSGQTPCYNRILLAHSPVYIDHLFEETKTIFGTAFNKTEQVHIDSLTFIAMLSGHSHGGQVTIFGIPIVLPQGCGRYFAGWYRDVLPHVFVSRGIGCSILPIRIMTQPELTLFEWHIF